ncbi:MAG: hypothetical protein JRE40_11995 [Deltaproteobacteria bacterium]|nr:hypothetical protein [Deltaproteobacteria bacterium]
MDRRHLDGRFPVALREFAQGAALNGASGGGLIKTSELANINGVLEEIKIVIGTAAAGALVFTVAITDADGRVLYTEGSLADATTHRKSGMVIGGTDADFQAALMDGTLTCTMTADQDPTGVSVTCDVTIYYR